MMNLPRPRWSPTTKLTVVLLLLSLGLFLLYRFREAIQPLILALILAYVLAPIVAWFQKTLRVRRALATALVYLLLLAVSIIVPLVIIPPLAVQSNALNEGVQSFFAEIETLLGHPFLVAGQVVDLKTAIENAAGSIQSLLEPFFSRSLEFVLSIITSLVWVIFILIVSFYLIKDAERLRSWFEELIPPDYRHDFIRLREEISAIWSAFFRGQIILASVVAVIFTVIGFIIGLPFALAMGALAGLLEFLPSLGHGIWLVTAALLALFGGSTWLPIPHWAFMLLVIGLHLFFQQFDLNYLIPRIIGRQVHLPPLVVILGIVTGALLAGVLGILLAAPTIASARVMGRYVYANLFDQDPFPMPSTSSLPPPDPLWWRKNFPVERKPTERS